MTSKTPWLAVVALLLGSACIEARAAPVPGSAPQVACRARAVLPQDRPRVGLVLGGGGARGIAHISVLRKLEAMQVPVDCIAGTSMGALVGALYASGMSVDDIETTVLQMDWSQMFDDSLARSERSYRRKTDDTLVVAAPGIGVGAKGVKIAAGLLAGERILLLLERLIEPVSTIEDFDRLPIPFRAIAADINTGMPLVMAEGDLAMAMRASMSIPGVFAPVQIGEHVLVDGGVVRNLPVDVVRGMGADVVIAVDVGTPLATMTTQSSALAITGQLTGLLTVGNTRAQIATLAEGDVLITPPLGDVVATADFDKGKEALAIGKQGVDAAADRLAVLSLSDEAYAQHRMGRAGRQATPPLVQFVRLDNRSRYRDDLLLARIPVPLDQPLDAESLDASLYRIHGTGTLSQSSYEVVEEDGKTGVLLHVVEKSQGPNYLEAGLSMSGDLQGSFDFSLRVGVLHSPVNGSGGEVRYLLKVGDETGLMAEYYQPFGPLGQYFLTSRIEYERHQINMFDANGDNTAEYNIAQSGGRFFLGRELGNYGALSAGLQRYTGKAEVQIGDPALPDIDTDTGEVVVTADVDRLDSMFFPRQGYLARARYTASRESLGADSQFEQLDVDALAAMGFGKHSMQAGLRYHSTLSGVAPIQSLYRLGGYSRLVGFKRNELTGQHYAVLLAGYSYQIGKLLDQEALAGISLEYGNAWQERSDMRFDDAILNGSAYIGLDSWLGPIMFGLGAREGGEFNLFLELGHRF